MKNKEIELTDEEIEFLEKTSEEEIEELIEIEEMEEESLKKAMCCRCGHRKVATKGGRCGVCLKKLNRRRHTPGDSVRAHYVADAALRRQDGKNGTASHKSKGRGTRDSIVKQTMRAEQKTKQELSPDRKDNSKGYHAKNTRMVPKSLNRGRHTVDPKKLSAWKKRLKKSLDDGTLKDELIKSTLAAYEQDNIPKEEMLSTIRSILDNSEETIYKTMEAELEKTLEKTLEDTTE